MFEFKKVNSIYTLLQNINELYVITKFSRSLAFDLIGFNTEANRF